MQLCVQLRRSAVHRCQCKQIIQRQPSPARKSYPMVEPACSVPDISIVPGSLITAIRSRPGTRRPLLGLIARSAGSIATSPRLWKHSHAGFITQSVDHSAVAAAPHVRDVPRLLHTRRIVVIRRACHLSWSRRNFWLDPFASSLRKHQQHMI